MAENAANSEACVRGNGFSKKVRPRTQRIEAVADDWSEMNGTPLRPTLSPTLAGLHGPGIEPTMQLPLPRPLSNRIPFSILLALAVLPSGCFNPLVMLDTDDGASDGATTDAASSDGGSTDAMTTAEPDGSSSDEPPPVCGNAVVEGDELCDDGLNDGSYGGCSADCSAPGPFCGDGITNGDEPCDDGDDVDGNGCNVDCVVSGSVLWTVTVDGPDHGIDEANGITADSAGNVIVSGTLNLGDDPVGWLRKYSPQGASAWTLDITGPTGPARNGPVATLIGDDTVFGGSYGANGPAQDAWVRRVSSAGELAWTQTHASPQGGWDLVVSVDVDQDGNIYALFEESQLPVEPSYRTFVRKYTPAGSELWTQFHEQGIRGRRLSADGQGRYVVAGTQAAGGVSQLWLQQSTSDGSEIWEQVIDNAGSSNSTALSVNSEGTIALTTSPSDSAPRAILLSSNGEETAVLFPHPEAFLLVLYSAHLEDDGNLLLGGTSVTPDDAANGWISKYDANGMELWTNTHDGVFDVSLSFDSVVTITTDTAGNVVAAGRIHDSADSLSNIWISKYAP